jgi:hypothetical protein
VYFTEPEQSKVRKIDTNGYINTIAGVGFQYWNHVSGDGGVSFPSEEALWK